MYLASNPIINLVIIGFTNFLTMIGIYKVITLKVLSKLQENFLKVILALYGISYSIISINFIILIMEKYVV